MDWDDAFANAAHIPKSDTYPVMWDRAAEALRGTVHAEIDLHYGESPRERLDIFHPERLARGTVVFVHGGYWLRFGKRTFSHLAAGPLAAGWAVAMPSYDLAPAVSIAEITRQVHRAISVVADRVPGPLRLTGHSAGGHLVSRMLDPALRASWSDRVEKVVPISPVADLAPLMHTKMNADLKIDDETAQAESPVHQPAPRVPVHVWVGADERPVFISQAEALAKSWSCDITVEEGHHHFNVIEGLQAPDSPLTQVLLG